MRARLKRTALAVAAAAAMTTATAGSAEAVTWVTYYKLTQPGPCSVSPGVWDSGTVAKGSRFSSPWYVSSYRAYNTIQSGVGQIAFNVQHYSQWRKGTWCESGLRVTRYQTATVVLNCYHEFWARGFLVTTAWSNGKC